MKDGAPALSCTVHSTIVYYETISFVSKSLFCSTDTLTTNTATAFRTVPQALSSALAYGTGPIAKSTMLSNTDVHDFAQIKSTPSIRRSRSTRVEEVLFISLNRQNDLKFEQDFAYLHRTLLSKSFSPNDITDLQSAATYVSNTSVHLAAIIVTDDSITRSVREEPIISSGRTSWLFHENGCLYGRWRTCTELVLVEQYKMLTKDLVKWTRAGGTVIFGCR